jgi:hypothetical protein
MSSITFSTEALNLCATIVKSGHHLMMCAQELKEQLIKDGVLSDEDSFHVVNNNSLPHCIAESLGKCITEEKGRIKI